MSIKALRKDVMTRIHEGHQGAGEVQNASTTVSVVVWYHQPSARVRMQDLPELSKTSERTSHANKASRVSVASVVGTDFFELDKRHYLIVTDYFSRSVTSQLNNIQLCYHSPKSCFRTSWDSNKLSEVTVVHDHSTGHRNRQYICDYGLSIKTRVLQNNFSV